MGLNWRVLTAIGAIAGALALAAAGHPPALANVQPGLWEIIGAPGTHAPVRQCVTDVSSLARFEHRNANCNARVVKDGGASIRIDYTCPGAGFGESQIDVLTPRSLRINTQGISSGLPFNYTIQARRLDDCPQNPVFARH